MEGFNLETKTGQRTILSNHINYVGFFDFTELKIIEEKDRKIMYLSSGYVHVTDDEVMIIAEIATEDLTEIKRITPSFRKS